MSGTRGEAGRLYAPGASVGAWVTALVMGVLLIAGCVSTAEVVQGKVIAVESGGTVIRVQNERTPDAPAVVIDISHADMGTAPAVGDVVRVAFRSTGGSNKAVRVMNVTRDRERQKTGH